MDSLEVKDLHMSGARAVFSMGRSHRVKEADIADAFAEQGMQLESFEKVRRPRAAALFTIDTGIT
jgi:hypothetical protein